MEIQSLRLLVTDADLAAQVARALPPGEAIEDLEARFTPEGVVVSGKYPTPFFKVSFETVWVPEPAGAEVRVRLGEVKVAGLPGNLLRGALMKMVRDNVEGRPGVRMEEEAVVVHFAELARAQGVNLAVRFREIRLSIGAAEVVVG